MSFQTTLISHGLLLQSSLPIGFILYQTFPKLTFISLNGCSTGNHQLPDGFSTG